MKACLILSSNEYVDKDGFKYCETISNKILYLNKIKKEDREKLYSFLDNACGLFDRPVFDYNKLSNILKMLYGNFEVIDETTLKKIQQFIFMYKKYGLSLFLALEEKNV